MLAQRNKNAIIAIIFTEIALLALFAAIVTPGTQTSSDVDGTTILFYILPAIGFLYINNYKRPYFLNVVGNFIIIVIFTTQMSFLFLALALGLKYTDQPFFPQMHNSQLRNAFAPVLMITMVYSNLKGFVKLQDLLIIIVVGSLGFSSNAVIGYVALDVYDFGGGLIIYLFGSAFYLAIRLVGLPVRIFSHYNKVIPITNNMAAAGTIVALMFFPHNADGFIGLTNTFYCQLFALVGYLIVRLNKTNTIRMQRIFELSIASGVLMSVGGTFFQNLIAPSIIGLAFGAFHSLFGELIKGTFERKISKVPDPSNLFWLFGIPAIFASIFAAIAIGSYQISSTNKMGSKFPYPEVIADPLVIGGKQFAFFPITFLMAAGTGVVAGIILKYTADNNEVEAGDLLWDEEEQTILDGVNEGEVAAPVAKSQYVPPPPPPQYQAAPVAPPRAPQYPGVYQTPNNNQYQHVEPALEQSFQNPDVTEQLYRDV